MSDGSTVRTYSAFISYRHAEADMRVAKEIHRKLERYHLDRDVRKQSGRKSLAPIFRDEDELPISSALDDDLIEALRNASALIVVCSPRTNESMWVAREVDVFLETHDQSRVFVALCEGEPRDVVPPRLLKKRGPDGQMVDVEPLAANFRTECTGASRRNEVTRLAAGILGVPYDSLVKRAQRRRQRIISALTGAAVAASTAFGIYNAYMNSRIQANYQQAMQRRSQYLATEAGLLVDDGNTIGATELALAALPDLTQPDTLDRPVVPEAVYALQQATNAGRYGTLIDQAFTTTEVYPADADLRQMTVSSNERYVSFIDETEVVSTWDVREGRKIFSGRSSMGHFEDVVYTFVLDTGNTVIVYSYGVVCRDAQDGSVLWSFASPENTLQEACVDERTQGRLLVSGAEKAFILDLETGEQLFTIKLWDLVGDTDPLSWSTLLGAACSKGDSFSLALTVGDETGRILGCYAIIIDAQTGEAHAWKAPGYYAYGLGMLDDGSLVMMLSAKEDGSTSDRNKARSTEYTKTVDYQITIACLSAPDGTVRWKNDVTVWEVGFAQGISQLHDEKGQALDQVAIWFCDLFLYVDVQTGDVLNQLECASSIVGGSLLSDGQTFLGVQSDGSLFVVGPDSNDVWAYRVIGGEVYFAKVLPSSELYLIRDDVAYAYRGTITDEHSVSTSLEPYQMQWSFAAKDGFVMVTMPTDRDVVRLEYHDGTTLDLVWGKDLGDDGLVWFPVAFDEDEDALVLQGMEYNEGEYFTKAMIRVDAASGQLEHWDVTPPSQSTLCAPDSGGISEAVDGVVAGNAVYYQGDKLFSPILDTNGKCVISVVQLSEGTSTCLAVADGFGQGTDRGDRHLYLHIDPTGKRLLYQDASGGQEDDSGLMVSQSAILDLTTGASELLDEPVAILWDGVLSSHALQGHATWSDDGKVLACVYSDGIHVKRFDGKPDVFVPLDGKRVGGSCIVGDRLLVEMTLGFSGRLESYSLKTGERLADAFIDDGSSWRNEWDVVPTALAADGSGALFVTTESFGYLVDLETLEVCQRFVGGRAYGSGVNRILCTAGDNATYYAHLRYSLQQLVDRGHQTLGSQSMGEEWLKARGA